MKFSSVEGGTVRIQSLLIALILGLGVNTSWAADVAAGKEVFSKKCASCHGAGGEGRDTMAKMLKIEFRHLGSKEVQAKTDADLKKAILEGTGKMRAVKDVDAKSADDIVAFLRTLKK
jgi:mono/diheme cytochrome c family protein